MNLKALNFIYIWQLWGYHVFFAICMCISSVLVSANCIFLLHFISIPSPSLSLTLLLSVAVVAL